MIPVTRPSLPDPKKYQTYLDGIFKRAWLTNQGPLCQELKVRLEEFLGVQNLLLVNNGTIALQIAYKALNIRRQAVTTPFSFVATTSTLQWEGIRPIFADIDRRTYNLDPRRAEAAITPETDAIVAVHVYGNPCDTQALQEVADRRGLKLVYDAAHAFGVKQKGQSVLSAGDISTLSFHATKVFHTVEGGALICRDADAYERASRLINFGINPKNMEIEECGINAKLSEVHAAMGLCILDDLPLIIEQRAEVADTYRHALASDVELQRFPPDVEVNHAYFPIVLKDEASVRFVQESLKEQDIMSRRYFYPSLDQVADPDREWPVPNSHDLASRVLCLPMYAGLKPRDVERIISLVRSAIAVP